MTQTLSPGAQRVQEALKKFGLELNVVEMPATTRSSVDAAHAIGCQLGQIVKSLIFRGLVTDSPVLVLASGANRVDETRLAGILGEAIQKADADYVRQHTGFSIGGVPPLGHSEILLAVIDEDLFQYDEIWAAAGTSFAVFKLTPQDLLHMTGGRIAAIKLVNKV